MDKFLYFEKSLLHTLWYEFYGRRSLPYPPVDLSKNWKDLLEIVLLPGTY